MQKKLLRIYLQDDKNNNQGPETSERQIAIDATFEMSVPRLL